MAVNTSVHGTEIIEIVSMMPDGISLDQLAEIVAHRFGESVTFYTCTTEDMTLDAVLKLGVLRRKLVIRNGMVFKGKSPICPYCPAVIAKRGKAQRMLPG